MDEILFLSNNRLNLFLRVFSLPKLSLDINTPVKKLT